MNFQISVFVCICVGFVSANPLKVSDEVVEKELQKVETPSPDIGELFGRIFALVDKEPLAKFLIQKLANDPDAHAVFRYLRGAKGKAIVRHLASDPEYQRLAQWFYDNGATSIYKTLNRIRAFFGWDLKDNGTANNGLAFVVDANLGRSIQKLLEELLEVLPVNDMFVLTVELYQSEDPAAIALIQRLRQPEMAAAWQRLKRLPEITELGDALIEGGIAVEFVAIVVESFFGWA